MLGTLLQGTEGEGIPDSPRIRTFKVGINHCGRMLIGGALKLTTREDTGIFRMRQVRCRFLGKAKIQG